MLIVTSVWTALVYTDKELKKFVFDNLWLFYTCTIVSIAIMCAMMCCYQKFRRVPVNYIMLGTFTITHTYMVAGITSQYDPEIVVSAAICTTGMFFALTAYACFTKTDMTKMGGALSTATIMVFCFMFLFMFFDIPFLRVILVVVVIILMSVWVVYDTQLIIGNKKKYRLEMDDYTLGALIIYTDVITIFLYIMELFGGR